MSDAAPHDLAVQITGLAIDNGMVVLDFRVEPAVAGVALVTVQIADGLGSVAWESQDNHDFGAGTTQRFMISIPAGSLDDGDYVAWARVFAGADGHNPNEAVHGVSMIVARRAVYASPEAAPQPEAAFGAFSIERARIDDRWFRADIANEGREPITVVYDTILVRGDDRVDTATGTEHVGGSATSMIHWLLPDELADGEYQVWVSVRSAGSLDDGGYAANASFRSDANRITPT